MEERDAARYATVIAAIGEAYAERRQARHHALAELIPALVTNSIDSREQNRIRSRSLNVFHFFNPGETAHSRLLAYFLDPQATHGQGDLFLVKFLKLLGISAPESVSAHPWIVTAEVGRVDVLIRRTHPHSVIVIENKSNGADDQPNQLYRYWYQEIYQKQPIGNAVNDKRRNPERARYRILYLSPGAWKQADPHSVRRPDDWDKDLPATVPANIVEHQQFGEFVVDWLNAALGALHDDNHRLREFTKQYIQFWETYSTL